MSRFWLSKLWKVKTPVVLVDRGFLIFVTIILRFPSVTAMMLPEMKGPVTIMAVPEESKEQAVGLFLKVQIGLPPSMNISAVGMVIFKYPLYGISFYIMT
jgi:hypothetical protein